MITLQSLSLMVLIIIIFRDLIVLLEVQVKIDPLTEIIDAQKEIEILSKRRLPKGIISKRGLLTILQDINLGSSVTKRKRKNEPLDFVSAVMDLDILNGTVQEEVL